MDARFGQGDGGMERGRGTSIDTFVGDAGQNLSDWGADTLSNAQQTYAASDVLYLHTVKAKLDMMLAREGRTHLAEAAFAFLPTRCDMDLMGYGDMDIFSH